MVNQYKLEKWAFKVKERDNFRCVECGSNENIHSHHIKPKCKHPELIFDVNNGETLCSKCHYKKHGPKPKTIKNNNTIDYRLINIDKDFWTQVKIACAEEGISIRCVILKLLERFIESHDSRQ